MNHNPRGKRHQSRGNWWPYVEERGTRRVIWLRYGVLETSGYYAEGPRYNTSYHVVDLARCSTVVKTFSVSSRPGMARAMDAREKACLYAAALNEHDRQEVAA